MKQLYLLSGLGADERVFQYIDLPSFEIIPVRWIAPHAGETIGQYAQRLLAQIPEPNPVLVGVSFGGIMAVELAQLIPVSKIILIASAKTKNEIPFYYRISGFFRLHYLLPYRLLCKPNAFANWAFGTQNIIEQDLLASILKDTDPRFLKWAIDKIVRWKNKTVAPNLNHIHGTADRILPLRFVHADISISGGGHFMTINKAAKISLLLNKLLRE